jgi:hypothetical protein
MATLPNDASAKSKTEGDRWTSDSETVERAERHQAPDEEVVRRSSEQRDYTPRRHEQPAEDDPVMPSNDSSRDSKI